MSAARHKGKLINHAMMRAQQRYGLTLTIEDLKAMTHAIHRNKGKLLARLPENKSAWALPWQGQTVKLIMSPDLWKILTILPPDAEVVEGHVPKKRKRRKQRAYFSKGKRYFAREAA
jgi:hypothetical protein